MDGTVSTWTWTMVLRTWNLGHGFPLARAQVVFFFRFLDFLLLLLWLLELSYVRKKDDLEGFRFP
jgi:hypothetical protein